MNFKTYIFDLELKHTFGLSRGAHDIQRTFIVELGQNGLKGLGEATENPYYNITVEQMEVKMKELAPILSNYSMESPELFWEFLQPYLKDMPFLHCAIDIAANDLFGKIINQPLYQFWGYEAENLPKTNFTIAIDTLEIMKEKVLEQPWPLYKIKLGTDHDIEIIQELRKITDAPFRIDANTGWTPEQTVKNAPILKKFGVEFIEQPLNADDWEGMKYVYKNSVLPIIADESCEFPEDIAKCKNHFHGVNVKLVKCGGLTPARKMVLDAKKLGLKTMVGCMTESSIGISAVGQLLPLLDYVDMDGALLLKYDIATGIEITDDGMAHLSNLPGTGAALKKEYII